MKIKFNITKQFILFLISVSLAPILLISGLFYQDIETKFNDRINNLLVLGALVADDNYKNDLETLDTSTRQAVSVSISQAFRQYQDTHNLLDLQKKVSQFQKIHNLDILNIYDSTQKQILTTNKKLGLPSAPALIQKALQGKTVSSIERAYNKSDKDYRLVYLSASPIINSDENLKKPIGVLLNGYSMSQHFSFKDILLIFPQLDMRILVTTPSGTRLRSSSNPNLKDLNVEQLRHILKKPQYVRNKPVSAFFKEESANETYRSLAFPFLNAENQPVGYIVVSSSESDLLQLKHKNILYVVGFLVLVGILISFAAYGFNEAVIEPVDELANVSEAVAQGDLQIRVQERQKLEKVQKMMQNFNKMLSQLEEDHLLRATFVSTLTHDLRTPLFAQQRVLWAIGKMKDTCEPDLVEMIEAIEKGNTQLIEMVNKLLEAYQYESGRISIYPEQIDLHQLITACFEDLSPLALQKSIEMKNEVPEGFMLYIDPEQFQRVFHNLIGNAIANIQANRQVIVQAAYLDSTYEIQVRDNGPGISKEVQPHLFQRYFTGHSKQKIGTGLGLFICRMIIELHQGSIAIESQLGQGTTFIITLPQYDREDLEDG